jgi:hypothetical protein
MRDHPAQTTHNGNHYGLRRPRFCPRARARPPNHLPILCRLRYRTRRIPVIVSKDNKTITHHKAAARVVCVFSKQDALVAARAEQNHQHQQSSAANASVNGHTGSSNPSGTGGLRSGSSLPNGAAGGPSFSFVGQTGLGLTADAATRFGWNGCDE